MRNANNGAWDLGAMRRRMGRWRERHGGPGRAIPNELWDEAVEVARLEGVPETARALRLDARRLKRRLEATTERTEPLGDGFTAFVELGASELSASGRSAVEVVNADGERMRIEVAGGVDAEALVRAFRARR